MLPRARVRGTRSSTPSALQESHGGQIRGAHPCKKRKDGAASSCGHPWSRNARVGLPPPIDYPMNRTGQILLEILVAAILLVVLVPYIPTICWKYAGPDWAVYSAMVADNNAQIYLNEQKDKLANLQAQLAALEAAKVKRGHDTISAEMQLEHRQAMKLLDGFNESQKAVLAGCVIEASGRINQSQKDQMIFNIWLAASEPQSCQELSRNSAEQLSRVAHLNQ
jgi:hypothetical protein